MVSKERGPHQQSRKWKRRWTVRLVIIATLTMLVTLFVAANFVLVEVRLIFWQGEVRLAWAMLLAYLVGLISAILVLRLSR